MLTVHAVAPLRPARLWPAARAFLDSLGMQQTKIIAKVPAPLAGAAAAAAAQAAAGVLPFACLGWGAGGLAISG